MSQHEPWMTESQRRINGILPRPASRQRYIVTTKDNSALSGPDILSQLTAFRAPLRADGVSTCTVVARPPSSGLRRPFVLLGRAGDAPLGAQRHAIPFYFRKFEASRHKHQSACLRAGPAIGAYQPRWTSSSSRQRRLPSLRPRTRIRIRRMTHF